MNIYISGCVDRRIQDYIYYVCLSVVGIQLTGLEKNKKSNVRALALVSGL